MKHILTRVQEIHDESMRKGMGRIFPNHKYMVIMDRKPNPFLVGPGGQIPASAGHAACAWWLQRWLVSAGCQPDTGGLEYLVPIAETYLGMEPRP